VASFPKHWQRITPLALALLPLAWIFGLAGACRRWLYRIGVLRIHRLPVPVVVVGNLVVGGTGKTPLVLDLVEALLAAGYRPGIVSRGYGGSSRRCMEVRPDSNPDETGDETLLLARQARCPVWIGADRVEAGKRLLAAHSECDIVVSDDGLQHYRLARDLEIAVEDERGHGNGFPLPAGPMREPPSRRVDVLVVNGEPHVARRSSVAEHPHAFRMTLEPQGFLEVASGAAYESAALEGKRLHAVAGIGNPARFFHSLRELGFNATPHAFPDHHRFVARDLQFADCDAVLMTEKDGVKCSGFGPGLYALRVRAKLDPGFHPFILARLAALPFPS
jgi:tetraacyldisaccharide 4'-kinase